MTAPLNLTPGKVRAGITAIVEKTFPAPRGELCLPVGDMERALAEHVNDLLHAVYAEIGQAFDKMRDDHKQQIDGMRADHDNKVKHLRGRLDRAEALATSEQQQRFAAERRLAEVAMVRCWTNEDGKRFVFADDLRAALDPEAANVADVEVADRG